MFRKLIITGGLLLLVLSTFAQRDVMLQTFYWDVPVDAAQKKGLWWINLTEKADDFKTMGITGLWLPAPSKGNWGIYDMGYGVFDHYDLGNYYQKGSVETRFGSRAELERLVKVMQDTTAGSPYVDVYADIILNHMYASDENAEANPIVKKYVLDEAFRMGKQRMPYPTNEIKWVIPDAEAGEYLIGIKGYNLEFAQNNIHHGYEVHIDYENSGFHDSFTWKQDLEGEKGLLFPGSGHTVRAIVRDQDNIDTYRFHAPGGKDIVIRLSARKFENEQWLWADQTLGYYPFTVIYKDENIEAERLEAHTNTNFSYPARTAADEPNYQWNYTHFNPASDSAWLEGWSENGELMPFTKAFGNDINTLNPDIQQRLNDWGKWLVKQIQFDGFRLDFVWGYQEAFAASWIANLPLKDNGQRFIVAEYWGPAPAIHSWVNNVATLGAQAAAFDFPLKETLTTLCNGDEQFDMRQLNHAGMIRNKAGYALPVENVVTFLENHDTGKEHDKWVTQDWHLGHAYLLTHEGRPCLFYPHLYGVTLEDMGNRTIMQDIPVSVGEDIRKLVHIRNTYLGGGLGVLSQSGNPTPAENTRNVYIARRQGNQEKQGAILVLNNHHQTRGLNVQVNVEGFSDWRGMKLVDLIHPGREAFIDANGEVWLDAPGRGYAVFVPEGDL